jgi:pyruvate/2-oxoglutarate dehydrogenase complex dihydrolipoamide acyltransferase (E2) component
MPKMILKMPKLAVSMREGTLAGWLVESGATVEAGQPLYEVETDKTTTEVPSPFSGTVTFLMEAGELCDVGTPIAEIIT